MTVTGRKNPVVNGRKPKFSFITLDSDTDAFDPAKTKCVNPVTDNHGRKFTGKVRVLTPRELRLRLQCDKERDDRRGEPGPGTLTITLSDPNVVNIPVPVDYVEDDET